MTSGEGLHLDSSSTTSTELMTRQLLKQGAVRVAPAFTVAGEGQGEVVHQGERLLVTPNDTSYRKYAEAMQAAGLPFIAPRGPSTEEVVVGEIPRDARTLPQVVRSKQPEGGPTSKELFHMLGRLVDRLMDRGFTPQVGALNLERILVLRHTPGVLLVPPIALQDQDSGEVSKADLVAGIEDQLKARYAHFGGTALLSAFKEGMRL